jgi:hypothetical protein
MQSRRQAYAHLSPSSRVVLNATYLATASNIEATAAYAQELLIIWTGRYEFHVDPFLALWVV